MGKASRLKAARRAATRTPAPHRLTIPGAQCPGGHPLYLLPGPAGLMRCGTCGWQGQTIAVAPDGTRSCWTPEGMVPLDVRRDSTFLRLPKLGTIEMKADPEMGIFLRHPRGVMLISPWGALTLADGVFNDAWLLAETPGPCDCGSVATRWLEGDSAHALLDEYARQVGRRVIAHRCEGKAWHEVEGHGGRVGRCAECGAVRVVPTDPTLSPQLTLDGEMWGTLRHVVDQEDTTPFRADA